MKRAVIMSLEKKEAIALAPGGRFVRIRRRPHFRIGDEIEWESELQAADRGFFANRKRVFASCASAAALVLLLVGLWAFRTPPVVAYVTMDVNPSVEFGLDSNENVRELHAINGDARPIVEAVADYKGKPVAEVTARLAAELASRKLLSADGEVVLASVAVGKVDVDWEAEVIGEIEEAIRQAARQASEGAEQLPEITVVSVPEEVREEAIKSGVSAGKMAFWLKAESQGHEVPLETLRRESLKTIASDWGGVDRVLAGTGNENGSATGNEAGTESESASADKEKGKDEWKALVEASKAKVEEDKKQRDERRATDRQHRQEEPEQREDGGQTDVQSGTPKPAGQKGEERENSRDKEENRQQPDNRGQRPNGQGGNGDPTEKPNGAPTGKENGNRNDNQNDNRDDNRNESPSGNRRNGVGHNEQVRQPSGSGGTSGENANGQWSSSNRGGSGSGSEGGRKAENEDDRKESGENRGRKEHGNSNRSER
ncbi:anti-sigma factor domain-containing protein [Cohnella algarum]|uniref:anti-sigma-I factor RsgI family protein n=1 Tax=Cohnella algarum TaxID=2044859 RepID=UPI001967171C|nr:anti-sigma factor domain-containing protein [Cohnella algarum]MBN2979996.1 anti-sigma factor domain-containing protein [Cohnella algarum]